MSGEELQINPYYDRLLPILKTLSESPGVYRYYDKEGTVIYVGKAKNLKNRVLSYFRNDSAHNSKTRLLVRKIYNIEFVYVNTETEALLLECNLIKKYKPRYNILLKDDKSYPWLRITNDEYPKIFITRHVVKDGSAYFGPYASVHQLRELMEVIRKMFCYRTCSLVLTQESIAKGRFKACLNYQIKLCNAPCQGLESKEEYNHTIASIKEMIKGNVTSVLKDKKTQMLAFAKEEKFEQAQAVKEQIMLLENYQSRSAIVSATINDVEVYAYAPSESSIHLNMMKVSNGKIVSSYSLEVVKKLDETDIEVFTSAIIQSREKMQWRGKEIIVPQYLDLPPEYVRQTFPRTGDKKQLLDLCEHNAKLHKLEKIKRAMLVDPERHAMTILSQMQKDLRMTTLPRHIECFDNSNIQGNYPVASCVVFRNAKPSKSDYRHFNIKTVVGADDFASMKEIIQRRYSRLMTEEKPLPDLVVVDGGKGQLSSTVETMQEMGILNKLTVIGIAKKLEEIYFPFDPVPLYLDRRSETLKVIQQIRDEAHRFGITHHRSKRNKATLHTELTDIEGIGEVTARDLLLKFTSVKRISNATLEELSLCIGKSKAQIIYSHYHNSIC